MHDPPKGEWFLPDYRPGEDEMWDRLGNDWLAIDNIHDGVRVYVRWEEEGGRSRVTGLTLAGGPITTDALRSISVSRLENLPAALRDFRLTAPERFAADMIPLAREPGEDPESFSERVAFYYRVFAATSSKPTKALAEHAGVPMATMRGWIREARLRGKLPPGTRGKAG